MKNYWYLFALLLLITSCRSLAQNRTLTGQVTHSRYNQPLAGVNLTIKGTSLGTLTDSAGTFTIQVPASARSLVVSQVGYITQEIRLGTQKRLNIKLQPDTNTLQEVVEVAFDQAEQAVKAAANMMSRIQIKASVGPMNSRRILIDLPRTNYNTEEYDRVEENIFLETTRNPLSTFSIDVDAASYSNVRRFLNNGRKPPKDAVRIEEMVNYFKYSYPQPKKEDPVAMITELAACPWNPDNQLLHIGLQGKNIPTDNLPPANLVFLIDVSGSMASEDKLPLVIAGFKLLVNQLRPQDKVAIAVYAGAAGLVLPPTPGNRKEVILSALEKLEAGGSTAGGEGIKLAYKVAQENLLKEGNNRVILATDGDFNVGVSSTSELERLIEEKRESGVFLTVLGFGTGNLKDSRMEKLADIGNGNYAYLDNIQEAKKVFVNEFGGTLFTIAKDVKLQLEFNPAYVKAYRLIGYENRNLHNEDFKNDKKDAGDLGAGHTVTALYEIIPASSKKSSTPLSEVDELKYQQVKSPPTAFAGELLTLKLRYKAPDGNTSKLLEKIVNTDVTTKPSENFRFAAAVAEFGMLLRDSEHKGQATYANVLSLAEGAKGQDPEGYRAEFVRLVKTTQLLDNGIPEAQVVPKEK
ncbi:vWA domain-containing protein [Adhaeribacter radiodurans]|uniref:von Willebrand factor type A domain-containing protein n=1 Tax=Adhaeribacter radiodurans TaxID=2745197 RepID=A0A7L7LDR1_9BACT|nr:VWA domain-containing protein [Adhaeribacter radiodurans]QMU30834.1 von Willebrand factor type A domain-containing protein [Adhaeribacter radiodurans]